MTRKLFLTAVLMIVMTTLLLSAAIMSGRYLRSVAWSGEATLAFYDIDDERAG